MKKIIIFLLLIFPNIAFATPNCQVLGGWPGAQYGLQSQILVDSLPCYGITGTKNSPVVLQNTPTVTTPNFTTSFSVDSVIFGSHDTNYNRIRDRSGTIGFTIGNTIDPTNYYANDVHTFTNKATTSNFANISSAGIGVYGATSGLPHIQAQAVAGTPTLTLPTGSGTFAVSATSPLSLNATTGALTCATCTTSAASLTANQLVIGSGSQGEQSLGSLGTTTTVLHGNAGGAPSFAAVTGSDISSNTVANSNLSNMTNGTTKCRTTAGFGAPEDCTGANIAAFTTPTLWAATAVDFNTTNTDYPIAITLPTGYTKYQLASIRIFNSGTTASLTTATYGVWTGAGETGTVLVTSGAVLSGITSNAALTSSAVTTSTLTLSNFWISSATNTIYFRMKTAQGAAASGTVVLQIIPFP